MKIIMTMLNLMAIISQQSWRDILLTALLASSILYYFVFKNAADISSKNETQVTSEEERRRRRDHLAKIAEERAKAKRIAAATADDDVASSSRDKCVTQEPKKVSAKVTSSSKQHHATSTEKKANATILPKEKVTKTVASNRIENKSPVQNKTKDVINNRVATAPNEAAAKTGTIDTPKGIDEPPKNKERDSKVEKSDVDTSKEVNNSSIGQADGDELTEKTVMDVDVSNNENNVATTLATTVDTEDAQENDQESITIYLIKSSSPRIELTIAKDATPSQLRQAAADATDIPLAGLRLIFRGRMIVEKSSGSVVDEFGIEEGSALHVVGKPKTLASVSSSTAPISQQQQQQQQQQPRTSQSQQDMTRLIHQGLQSNPNFFHYAAAAGNYELIQAAIRDGSFNTQLNRSDENGWTPLHEAIRGGHLHVVTLLLDEGGLDMHAITNQGDGFSPLSLSINYHGGDHQLARMLRDRGGQEWPEDVDDDSESESEGSSSSNDESNEEEDAERNPWRNS